MCGIAGILRFDGRSASPSDLDEMLRRLSHRGRDHCAAVAGSGGPLSQTADVVLGHRRLSIIDLSEAGAQPMASADGRLWLTFNGEIYNYIEIRHDLKARGHCFRTQTDSEVLIAAYREWGEACVSRLNGMFAFALWDEERRRLLCARDHLGIKPFYYAATPACFAFASESKALRQFHGNAIGPDGLASYLLGLYVPGNWSIFSGIAKLLPGHTMTVEPSGRIVPTRYWKLNDAGDCADTPDRRQALEQKLKQAVSRQLRSDVPVGALLSGGVDSGMVVALASAQGARLHTYSVGFEGLVVDELPAAASVANACRAQHHPAVVTAAESVELLDVSLARLSEPIADPAVVPSYLLSQMAAADGVKVLLSGTGGDEIFGGYDRYIGTTLRRRALTVIPEWARVFTGHLLPRESKLGARLRNTYLDMLFTAGGDFELCAATMGNSAGLSGFLSRLAQALPIPAGVDQWPLTYKQMGFDMHAYLPDEILLLFDQMSMAHTIEGRVPLLDVEVVEAAFRFPASSHVSGNRTKVLFREMASPYLGSEHVWRRKQGFAGPVPWWVRNNWPLFRDVAASTLSIPGMAAAGGTVRRLCEGREPASDGDSFAVFILYCLSRWYEQFGLKLIAPAVTVVIPTRNRLSLLKRAVDSVLRQTERDFELVVVDDGSTDGTRPYLEALAASNPRVRPLYNEKPGGGAVARNIGITSARGRWIAFLDDDDEWLPAKLALQLAALARHPGAVACSTWYVSRRWWGARSIVRVPATAVFDDLLQGSVMGGASMCLCNAETVRRVGGYDPMFRSGQDWDLWTSLSRAGPLISCKEPTVVYNEHRGSRITNNMRLQYLGARTYYFKYRAFMTTVTRTHRLASQCYLMSLQPERGPRRRLRYLAIAVRRAELGWAVRYFVSSAPRLLRDVVAPRTPSTP